MSLFSGIEDAKITGGGAYLTEGSYDICIDKVTVDKTRKGVPFFALDFEITGTSDPERHPLGAKRNWYVGFDKDGALSNVKQWGQAVLSCAEPGSEVPADQVTQKIMDDLCNKGGELVRGTHMRVRVQIVTTKGGNQFSRHTWFAKSQPAAA